MLINSVKSTDIKKYTPVQTAKLRLYNNEKNSVNEKNSNLIPLSSLKAQNILANFLPLSFKGNAPLINKAYVITSEDEDMPLLQTKNHDSYILDFDSQTEVIYGDNAKEYFKRNNYFKYDTQVIFPKKAKGVLTIGDKTISLNENSAVIIKGGTEADIDVLKGYPMILISKKDYDWYERYGRNSSSESIRGKFAELMDCNSHLYNGEFTPNSLLPERLRDEKFLKTLSIDKWQSKNNLVNDLYSKKDDLSEADKKSVELAKSVMDKLFELGLAEQKSDGFVLMRVLYNEKYMHGFLKENKFSDEQINLLEPVLDQVRQVKADARFSITSPESTFRPELINKMKEKGILFNNKRYTGRIYWRECFGKEESLRKKLIECEFTPEEQDEIINGWRATSNIGFDLSGLMFIGENIAVYNLGNKVNNWNSEKTPWITNSTALMTTNGDTPFLGVSMVQAGDKRVIPMSELRKEEKLHSHPNRAEKRQSEVYLITSGAAALNVVKNGKSQVKILNQGDLAVVDPGVKHCVNSVAGEYEQIVVQVPSAFQYGFGFKENVANPPADYNADRLTQEAYAKLSQLQQKGFIV